ncbi:MAG: hypothetical protein QUV05_02150 [Phycisphaerae bacterium]|jgi:hypothetical protein|nr:hypothetical protein [Phycisphaerae bacterium]
MQEKTTEYRMPIAIPNGIILALIGVLVLVTPLVETVEPSKLRMNIIAGAVMTVGGLASLLWGLRQTRRPGA